MGHTDDEVKKIIAVQDQKEQQEGKDRKDLQLASETDAVSKQAGQKQH